ncbi:TPA: recombinase family protein [Salmonella enterica subsp. enterica serovar Muenchen]
MAELKNSGVREDRIFTDIMSGATDEREGLQRLLGRAEKDDIIICTKMDRLGRNTADMIHIVDACYKRGLTLSGTKTHVKWQWLRKAKGACGIL